MLLFLMHFGRSKVKITKKSMPFQRDGRHEVDARAADEIHFEARKNAHVLWKDPSLSVFFFF